MYAVSNDYKTAMLAPVQERDVKGYIGTEAFYSDDIISGTFVLSNQCMESTDIVYGSVYVGELDMTVSPSFPISRKAWKGKAVSVEIGLKIGNAYEYVPCGVYTIVKANWRPDGVEIVAYDNMIYFDKTFPGREVYNNLTPYGYLSAACTACGVTLANTQAQIEAMPNGTEIFGIYEENSIETWRDLISFVAQALAGFATINRDGNLEIRQLGNATGITLDATKRYTGASLSDYTTNYTGVGVVLTEQNAYYYRATQVDDGETMKLGENPLLQHYLSVEINRWLDAILTELANFAFVPFKAKMAIDAAFDLGDVITYTGGLAATGGDNVCIMSYTYIYGRSFTAEGYGDDPYYANVQNKVSKSLDGLRGTTRIVQKDVEELKNSALVILWPNFTDDDPISDGGNNTVAEWYIQSVADADVAVTATLCFTIETDDTSDVYHDAVLTALVKVDGVTVATHYETYGDGEHTLTITHLMKMQVDNIYDIALEIYMDGGDLT